MKKDTFIFSQSSRVHLQTACFVQQFKTSNYSIYFYLKQKSRISKSTRSWNGQNTINVLNDSNPSAIILIKCLSYHSFKAPHRWSSTYHTAHRRVYAHKNRHTSHAPEPPNIYLITSIFFTLYQQWPCLAPHLHFIQNILLEVMWLHGGRFWKNSNITLERKRGFGSPCVFFFLSLFSQNGRRYNWRVAQLQ